MGVAAETLLEVAEHADGHDASLIPIGTFCSVFDQTPYVTYYVRSYDVVGEAEEYCRVRDVRFAGTTRQLFYVGGEGGCGVRCVPEQRVWVTGREWMHADDVRKGDELVTTYGPDRVDVSRHQLTEEPTYTLTVDSTETYFANDMLTRGDGQ